MRPEAGRGAHAGPQQAVPAEPLRVDAEPVVEGREAPAWYALRPGPWRDWVTVLHLPYTAWNLAYVLVGAGLAPRVSVEKLVATLLAFALAVGVAAHALDELHGRPLGTRIPRRALAGVAAVALAGAVALGVAGVGRVGWGLVGFIVVGAALVVAYNLELGGGRFHSGAMFALGWGSFPLLTSYYAQTATVRAAPVVAAGFAFGLSVAQRHLSTEARDLRRRVRSVTGYRTYRDGRQVELSAAGVLAPLERALAALSWSACALGVAMVLARTGH